MRGFLLGVALVLQGASLAAASAPVNGIEIWYETFGEQEAEPLLLNMGIGCSGMLWPVELCQRLADEGFYVIRYDYRDTGQSSLIDFETNPYDWLDLARDAINLLDHLEVERAHIVGFSMGGPISLIIAAHYHERAETLTLIATSCDFRSATRAFIGETLEGEWLSPPRPDYLRDAAELLGQTPETLEEAVAIRVAGAQLLHGGAIPFNTEGCTELYTEAMRHTLDPMARYNHLWAYFRWEDIVQNAALAVQAPTLIFHGTEDPLFGPDHAEALSASIENSQLIWFEGMGHYPHPAFYDQWIEEIKKQIFD